MQRECERREPVVTVALNNLAVVAQREKSIESQAFRRAALQSEAYRIIGLLCLLALVLLFATARDLAAGRFQLLLAQTLVLILFGAYELVMLATVKRAIQQNRDVSPALWRLNVLIETQLPTVALLLVIESHIIGPYQALAAPAVLLYFLFIILSTLRLSPGLSLLTGIASSLGYLLLILYTTSRYPDLEQGLAVFPLAVYFVYAAVILVGGILAAAVARQIRGHVLAALREAELQSKLDQVRHDLDVAKTIQQGLLPTRSPNLEDFELAGWNQPADQTGGDYFDWQFLPDGRLAISLGDATGHGIGPALVSASCRAYARAMFLGINGQNDLLDRLNRLLAEDLSANRFVTFAVVFLDPERSRIEILSAGHGPILRYSNAENTIENFEAQGIPLGMIAGVKYGHSTSGTLAAGDLLVLVTDGFYEWENPDGEEFGLTRLEDVIRESHDYPADEIIGRLRSAVSRHCRGTEQKDDLTAVVLKRKVQRFIEGDFNHEQVHDCVESERSRNHYPTA